jgi:hypothetical protein
MGLVHKDLPMETEAHAWETEHLNEAAGRQFKKLASLLLQPDALNDEALADVAEVDCQTTALHPPAPTIEWQDGPLTVRRMTGGPGPLSVGRLALRCGPPPARTENLRRPCSLRSFASMPTLRSRRPWCGWK